LLEWNPSGDPEHNGRNNQEGLVSSCRSLWIAPVIAIATVIYLALSGSAALAVAGPILGLWFASPAIAWWISRPLVRRGARLSDDQTIFLRKLSRKTWAFFETFVDPEDHWLPPDNYQEHPVAAVAHRTSPTNMGLALLANLSAHDFGYISTGQLIKRTENAFHTMKTLERYRGHFYNWYDTQSLKPLLPLYISTVDSGNLAGHLLTLRPGLLALPDQKIMGARLFTGLSDTLMILADAGAAIPGITAPAPLAHLQKELESAYNSPPTTLVAARLCLDQLATSAAEVAAGIDADHENPAGWWARAFARQCRDALDELALLSPSTTLGIDGIPTLRDLAGLGNQRAIERIAAIERLALQSGELARREYDFLFDKERHLLTIGYNVSERRRDASYYDLLASEARLYS
ncbi:MAG: hypothetical protein Q8M34_06425, partial [Thermodesulfovibrionales bacterium]|nr:hypothetical protein [Thermodesulfovibrionales bacterium]